MTLIQRQTALVEAIKPIYRTRIETGSFGGSGAGKRSKLKRLHAEEMMKAGYPKDQAWQSATDCDSMAWLEASCESVEKSLGALA